MVHRLLRDAEADGWETIRLPYHMRALPRRQPLCSNGNVSVVTRPLSFIAFLG
ncbi:unnamed protein product [Coffea canephora]|uniref:Uncharacterized protein n=1 Tax=Coffea canephora TaxID=49390 RepID=A0A068UHR4_COFCA|nr:unnamed protein product [Coffea canephora]